MAPPSPCFSHFYKDWIGKLSVRSLSLKARGLLIDLKSLAADGQPYGHLLAGGEPVIGERLAGILNIHPDELADALGEILRCVPDQIAVHEDGYLWCPELAEQERVRQARAAGGGKGGNPYLRRPGGRDTSGRAQPSRLVDGASQPSRLASTANLQAAYMVSSEGIDSSKKEREGLQPLRLTERESVRMTYRSAWREWSRRHPGEELHEPEIGSPLIDELIDELLDVHEKTVERLQQAVRGLFIVEFNSGGNGSGALYLTLQHALRVEKKRDSVEYYATQYEEWTRRQPSPAKVLARLRREIEGDSFPPDWSERFAAATTVEELERLLALAREQLVCEEEFPVSGKPPASWSLLQRALQQQLDAEEFATWFLPLGGCEREGTLYLVAPNDRFLHTLEESYRPVIEAARAATSLLPVVITLQGRTVWRRNEAPP